MKRTVLILFAVIPLAALGWWLRGSFSTDARIARHQRRLWDAIDGMKSSAPIPLFRRLNPFFGYDPDTFWYGEFERHQKELLRLGSLTRLELRLTNQVMTQTFYSNFFGRIRAEFGTNTERIWIGPNLSVSNNFELHPVVPVNDVAIWQRIFRECALGYASNVPPSLSTNSPSQ